MAHHSLRVPDVIAKKRDKKELNEDDIDFFIQGVVNGRVQDSQLGAMLMAIYQNGMSEPETVYLTKSMVNSGDTLAWPDDWSNLVVDKHSTGGVGDKVSLPLAPALAACGLKVPMISGRGLGHTGGTLDKLESIPGFNVVCTPERMREILDDVGCCIVSQTQSLVPADRILYATRDVTGTVASIPLISASIVSKKAAEKLRALVLDVKFGNAAFMKTECMAKELAQCMIATCNGLGINTVALLTRMDNPIGKFIGNSLEVVESLQCLHGDGPEDLRELIINLGGNLLKSAGRAPTVEEGCLQIETVLSNGSAMEKFCSMIQSQGVERVTAEALCRKNADVFKILRKTKYSTEIKSEISGFIQSIDGMGLAKVCNELGAGRTKAGEPVNHAVGIELKLHIADSITAGDVWIKVYHDDEEHLSENHITLLQGSIIAGNEPQEKMSRIADIIRG